MRKVLFFWVLIVCAASLKAQNSDFIHTSGKYILGACNDTLFIKGINYAPYNWGNNLSDFTMDEIAQTGANAVRMVWYWSNPGASVYYNYAALDSAISKCVQHKMIAIIELHDFTCGEDANKLEYGSGWWTNSFVFPILKKYKQSVIVNIANEALKVNWTSNPTASLATYKTTYQNIITKLRNVTGFDFPLMIDAPDCGQNADAFITNNTAKDLIAHDPLHNVIFSGHAYWYGFANNDSAQMAAKINNIVNAELPFVLGEIANQQDDVSRCQYNLNYQSLLNYCELQKVSWLAWTWDRDDCPNRQLTTNGLFANLTSYGSDIVNNSTYGLLSKSAPKSQYLVNNGLCKTTTGQKELELPEFTIAPNPAQVSFSVHANNLPYTISCSDLMGRSVELQQVDDNKYSIEAAPGVYVLTVQSKQAQQIIKIVIN